MTSAGGQGGCALLFSPKQTGGCVWESHCDTRGASPSETHQPPQVAVPPCTRRKVQSHFSPPQEPTPSDFPYSMNPWWASFFFHSPGTFCLSRIRLPHLHVLMPRMLLFATPQVPRKSCLGQQCERGSRWYLSGHLDHGNGHAPGRT